MKDQASFTTLFLGKEVEVIQSTSAGIVLVRAVLRAVEDGVLILSKDLESEPTLMIPISSTTGVHVSKGNGALGIMDYMSTMVQEDDGDEEGGW